MSLDERKRRELMQAQSSSMDVINGPAKAEEMRKQAEEHQKKELVSLKQQVQLGEMKKDVGPKAAKEGTGGLKKDEVLSADAKASTKQQQQTEKIKADTEKKLGTTEQSRKSA